MNNFKIYLAGLKNNQTEKIDSLIDPNLLNLSNEKELVFEKPFKITGKVYLTQESLIMNFDINFTVSIPCSICNNFTNKTINIKSFYITEDLKNISLAYDYLKEIRNVCVLEIPSFVECSDKCKKREELNKYLRKDEGDKHYPFTSLEI
ncbi:MAG: hypothetical protein K1060chlam5_00816 [Candidatus Anoxychlamydiales bacterium]|nr:hypothetical protein [Candidatus Anoxychlamydiales bacterium]